MAVNIILRVMLAVYAAGVGALVFMPMAYNISYNPFFWEGKPLEVIQLRDYVYGILIMLPLALIGIILIWGFGKASSKEPYDTYA